MKHLSKVHGSEQRLQIKTHHLLARLQRWLVLTAWEGSKCGIVDVVSCADEGSIDQSIEDASCKIYRHLVCDFSVRCQLRMSFRFNDRNALLPI